MEELQKILQENKELQEKALQAERNKHEYVKERNSSDVPLIKIFLEKAARYSGHLQRVPRRVQKQVKTVIRRPLKSLQADQRYTPIITKI